VILAAVSMMHDEEDVCVQVVRHLLAEGVDQVLVADNLSTDRTRALLTELERSDGTRLLVVDDPDPEYRQGEKMTALAREAHRLWRADWIVPFDADELWSGQTGSLREAIEAAAAAGYDAATADSFDFYPQPTDDPDDPDPFTRIRWCQCPMVAHKTAFRYRPDRVISAGNHAVWPEGRVAESVLTIRHYGVRSLEQARAKFRHGRTVLPTGWASGAGDHWRTLGALDDEQFAAWYDSYLGAAGLVRWEPRRATIQPEARSTPLA